MAKSVVVRYRTRPECAEENAEFIRAVFAELARTQPDGLSYHVYRLADDVSFVHVASVSGPVNPLTSSPAFAAFQTGIEQRCVEGPTPVAATMLGSFG